MKHPGAVAIAALDENGKIVLVNQYRPAIGATLRRRQAGLPPETLARSWKAQQRLHAKYAKMTARGKPPGVAVVAVARELAGFVWAEMTT